MRRGIGRLGHSGLKYGYEQGKIGLLSLWMLESWDLQWYRNWLERATYHSTCFMLLCCMNELSMYTLSKLFGAKSTSIGPSNSNSNSKLYCRLFEEYKMYFKHCYLCMWDIVHILGIRHVLDIIWVWCWRHCVRPWPRWPSDGGH